MKEEDLICITEYTGFLQHIEIDDELMRKYHKLYNEEKEHI